MFKNTSASKYIERAMTEQGSIVDMYARPCTRGLTLVRRCRMTRLKEDVDRHSENAQKNMPIH